MKYILRITTYRGLDWDATHYYGSIRLDGATERVDMEHTVDYNDQRYFVGWRKAAPGETRVTCRFLTTQDVLAEALRWMKENHPDDTLEVRDETDGE